MDYKVLMIGISILPVIYLIRFVYLKWVAEV